MRHTLRHTLCIIIITQELQLCYPFWAERGIYWGVGNDLRKSSKKRANFFLNFYYIMCRSVSYGNLTDVFIVLMPPTRNGSFLYSCSAAGNQPRNGCGSTHRVLTFISILSFQSNWFMSNSDNMCFWSIFCELSVF